MRMWLLLSMLLAANALPARAVEVAYFPRDIADVVVGDDRWVYEYTLDEFPYDDGYGFTVYFDPDLYADLDMSPDAPNAHWDAITVEPDANLGDDGFYDAEALVDLPSVGGVFRVSFVWLGAGSPGAQPFEVRDAAPSYATVLTGTTVLPEAGSSALGAGALCALLVTRRSLT